MITAINNQNNPDAPDDDEEPQDVNENDVPEPQAARVYTWEEEWDTIRDQIANSSMLKSMKSIKMEDRDEFKRFLKSPSCKFAN